MRSCSSIQSKFLLILFSVFIMYVNPAKNCRADEDLIRKEVTELKARIAQLEEKLAQQEERTEGIEEVKETFKGLSIGAGATFVVQGTIDANATEKKGEEAADGTYSCDLEIEKEFEGFGKAFLHLEAGGGEGVDGDELNLLSGANRDAGNTSGRTEVTELWYEHYFLEGMFTLTFGKLDPTCYLDDNVVANDETSQFLSFAFRNNAVLEFPDNGPGFRMRINPAEWIEINTGVFDDDADWEDIGDDIFFFSQVNVMLNPFDREGNYRLYAWHDNSYHAKLMDVSKTKEPNFGVGISFDQQLTDIVTCFTRFGWEDPHVSALEYAWSFGAQITGQPWGRNDDVFALAIGQDIPSDDYGKAGNPDDNEGHLEAYYNFRVNDHLNISPDIQFIWNPNGVGSGERDNTVTVIGLRTQVDF